MVVVETWQLWGKVSKHGMNLGRREGLQKGANIQTMRGSSAGQLAGTLMICVTFDLVPVYGRTTLPASTNNSLTWRS